MRQSAPAALASSTADTESATIWSITLFGALVLVICAITLIGLHGLMTVSTANVSAGGAFDTPPLSSLLPTLRALLIALSILSTSVMIGDIYQFLKSDAKGRRWNGLVLRVAAIGPVVMIGANASVIAEFLVGLIRSSAGSFNETTSVAWAMLAMSRELLMWGMGLVVALMGFHWICRVLCLMLDD